MPFNWINRGADGWRAEIGDITLYASPERTRACKPARGTPWRAGVSRWEESTRTIHRFGRDVYGAKCATAREAMALAETVFNETF